jgi:eukaryotic-like serine/threonine-protein kinase
MSGTLLAGTIFAGRYRVLRCIAAGAMGAVYEVMHLGTERRRALKVMHPHLFQSDEMRARFALEARITSRIESEYIVDVSDAGVDDATRTPFLVMELLHGEELGQRLKRLGRFSPSEVVNYLHQVAMALDRTHQAAIVHRDLKPENLFLTQREDGTPRIKILDFGVAKVLAETAAVGGGTQSLGTPLYMPPEQFHAGTRLTPAADIYALGMMAYTLLVGEPYWALEARQSRDVIAFAMVAVQGPVEPPVRRAAARGVALPAGFDAWFARMTAKDPSARFGKATDAVSTLAEALGVAPASNLGRMATSTGATVIASPREKSGSRLVVALVAGIGVLGVAAFAVVRWASERSAVMSGDAAQTASAKVAATTSGAPADGTSSSAATALPAPSGNVAAQPGASVSATTSAEAPRPPERVEAQPPAGSKKPPAKATPLKELLRRD